MATLLQSTSVSADATSVSVILGTGGTGIQVTAGSMLVAYVGSPTTLRTCAASDNVNGAYTTNNSGLSSGSICTFPNSAGGTITVTGTLSGAATPLGLIVEEWSGVGATSPFDKGTSNSGTTVTTGNTGTTATLSQANELCLAMMVLNSTAGGTFTVAAPFTAGTSSPLLAGTLAIAVANYQPNATTGQVATFNWTTSATARGWITTYELAAASSVAGQLPRQLYVMPRAAHRPSPTRKRWWWQNGILVPA